MSSGPRLLRAATAPVRPLPAWMPAEFLTGFAGREKRPLGDAFGLTRFGVNLTRLAPGAVSSLRHAHALQEEFVFILQGTPTLRTDAGEVVLAPGDCVGFPAGTGDAHQLVNRGAADALLLEIGDRTPGDQVTYPEDDLAFRSDAAGQGRYTRKDGTPIPETR